MELFTASGNVT